MQKFNLRYIILVSILGIAALVIFWMQNVQPVGGSTIDINKIPLNIGNWKGENSTVDQKTKDILETESVLVRKYRNHEGEEVYLAIVYYKDNRVALHLPESCYTGQGSHIAERGKEQLKFSKTDDFVANKFVLKGDKGNQVILYYFETSDVRTGSYQTMRWHRMINRLKSKSNSGALIRFSSNIINNPEETLKLLKKFIKEIGPLLPEYLI